MDEIEPEWTLAGDVVQKNQLCVHTQAEISTSMEISRSSQLMVEFTFNSRKLMNQQSTHTATAMAIIFNFRNHFSCLSQSPFLIVYFGNGEAKRVPLYSKWNHRVEIPRKFT